MKYLIIIMVMFTYSAYAQQKSSDSTKSKSTLDSTANKVRITNVVLSAPSKEWQRKNAIKSLLDEVGQKVTYCIFFYGGEHLKSSGTTLLYFGDHYPYQFLTVVIKNKDRHKFKTPPEIKFVDKELCIHGIVQNNNGKPEIIISDPKQLEIVYTSPYHLK